MKPSKLNLKILDFIDINNPNRKYIEYLNQQLKMKYHYLDVIYSSKQTIILKYIYNDESFQVLKLLNLKDDNNAIHFIQNKVLCNINLNIPINYIQINNNNHNIYNYYNYDLFTFKTQIVKNINSNLLKKLFKLLNAIYNLHINDIIHNIKPENIFRL